MKIWKVYRYISDARYPNRRRPVSDAHYVASETRDKAMDIAMPILGDLYILVDDGVDVCTSAHPVASVYGRTKKSTDGDINALVKKLNDGDLCADSRDISKGAKQGAWVRALS